MGRHLLESNGYVFKPHEVPLVPGSPAAPVHPYLRSRFYLLFGLIFSLVAGLQNGFLTTAVNQIGGELSLDQEEIAWLKVSYYMTYGCASILYFKIRQQIGLGKFIRALFTFTLLSNILQIFFHNYHIELIARGFSGFMSSGLMSMGIYYCMQSFSGRPDRIKALIMAVGTMQLGTPLAHVVVPYLIGDNNIYSMFIFDFSISLCCMSMVVLLPIPPTITIKAFEPLDILSFALYAIGVASFCIFWVQAPVIWWDSKELGGFCILGFLSFTVGLLIEYNRKKPMLQLKWMTGPQVISFVLVVVIVRLLTSEQTVGAAGLMTYLGMGLEQMVSFYVVVLAGSLCGLICSYRWFNMDDIRRFVLVSKLLIAIAAFIDMGVNEYTRPEQMYVTQFMLSFASLFFMGPLMIEGMFKALSHGGQYIMSFSAVFGLSNTVCSQAGVGIIQYFITLRTQTHLSNTADALSSTHPAFASRLQQLANSNATTILDSSIQSSQASKSLITQATTSATMNAYNDLFFVMGVVASLAFLYSLIHWGYNYYHGKTVLGKNLEMLKDQVAAHIEAGKKEYDAKMKDLQTASNSQSK